MAQEAVKLAPGLSTSHTTLGQAFERQGRHAEALPHLNQATALNPSEEYAHTFKAEIAVREDRPAQARASLDSAMTGTPHIGRRVTYRQNRAVLFLYDGKVREMMDDLAATAREAESSGQGPAAATVHFTMALLSAGVRDASGFEAHKAEAKRLNLAEGTIADAEVNAYAMLMNGPAARRALGDYVRLAAGQAPAVREENIHRMTGLTLVAEGKAAEAIPELKLGGLNPYAQLGLIEAYLALKQPQQADSVRKAMIEHKGVSYVSTARPIAKYRAANSRK
jgi:tetratricopeptide (TPR) repeat protein